MFSYEALKFFHLFSAFLFTAMACVYLLLPARNRLIMIIMYVAGMAILVGGMGLVGVLSEGFPIWMMVKLALWVLMFAFVGIVMKRFTALKKPATIVLLALVAATIYVAVVKPWY